MVNILLCTLLCALLLRASGVTRSETFPDGAAAAALPEPPCAPGALCEELPPGGSCCDPSEGEAPVDQQQDRPALEERGTAVPSGGQMRATLRLQADFPYGLFLFAFCTVLVFLVIFCCSSWYLRANSRKKRSSTEQLQQSCQEGQGSLESPGPSDVDLPLHHGASAEMALPLVVAEEPSDLLDCTPAEELRAGNCEEEGNTVSPGSITLPIFPPPVREPTVENESEDKMERPEC